MFKKVVFLFFTIFFLNNIGIFAAPSISNITDNRSSYTNSEIPRYKKFEISFDVENMDTSVTNLQLPYDSTPPAGITAGVGITVDGLFLPPGEINWDSAKIQPGFWYENFTMDKNDTAHTPVTSFGNYPDWIYAEGKEQWKIRFAPTQIGQWKYKIRVVDASGQTESSEQTFNVVSSNSKGFIRVSQADKRYFEFDNGEVFIPAGLSLMTQGITQGISQGILSRLWNNTWQNKAVENKLNLFRPWFTAWQELPIYGGYGSTRSSYFRFLKLVLNSSDTYGEPQGVHSGKYAYKKSVDDVKDCNYCYDYGARAFLNTSFILKPYAKYKYTGWIKTVNLQGDGAGAMLYATQGVFDWVTVNSMMVKYFSDTAWTNVDTNFKLTGDNNWTQVEMIFTNKERHWIYLGGEAWNRDLTSSNIGTLQGTAYFDDLSLKEVLADSTLGPEQLDKGDMEFHEHFAQRYSYQFDKLLEWAEANSVYFKVSIEEKQEETYTRIKDNGTIDAVWPQWAGEENYAGRAAGNTPLKWYEKAYWRYLIARWGYSTSIHSWEQFNEQDPNSSFVWQLTNEFGEYVRQNDPNRHLVTTSFWSGFPSQQFWSNPAYPNVDYADVHKYLNPYSSYSFWGNYFSENNISIETRPGYIYGGSGYSIKIPVNPPSSYAKSADGVIIQGNGTWTIKYLMKTENLQGTVTSNGLLRGGLLYRVDTYGDSTYQFSKVPRMAMSNYYLDGNIPPGTYDWTEFNGTFQIQDNGFHYLYISFSNEDYKSGDAWIDNVEIISPVGEKIYVNGEFDFSSKQGEDLALYVKNFANSLNAGKPAIWGEIGLMESTNTDIESELLKQDTVGVGFHNIIWSQISPSGTGVLYWHHLNEIYGVKNWIYHFRPYVEFMQGIPLNNGKYQDANASSNNINLRVWGQKDTTNAKAHLWIQNKKHTWKNIVDKINIDSVMGNITIPNMNDTTYSIDWWDTYSTAGTEFRKTKTSASGGNLTFSLPNPLSADVAVKISPVAGTATVPVLDWTGEVGYTNDGVDPENGDNTASFNFRVKYTEAQNTCPSFVRLLLNKNGDNDYTDTGEIIDMEEDNPGDNDFTGPEGKIYSKKITAPFISNTAIIPYKFEASNGIFPASGAPVTEINTINLNYNLSINVDTAGVNLNRLSLSSFSQPVSINVTNATIYDSASFTLQITASTSSKNDWSAGNASGKEVYMLKALFTGVTETPVAGDFNDDDIVTTTVKTSSPISFGNSKFLANGSNVPAGGSVKLWLLFKSPESSTSQSEQNISLTIGIVNTN
ncbi:MAG: hypothetical protein AB1498_10255 [bacterium]